MVPASYNQLQSFMTNAEEAQKRHIKKLGRCPCRLVISNNNNNNNQHFRLVMVNDDYYSVELFWIIVVDNLQSAMHQPLSFLGQTQFFVVRGARTALTI